MVVLINDVADYMFSSALDKIIFSSDQSSASFHLTMGDKVILSESYVPDANGRIIIRDLQDLLEPYLSANLIESFAYKITDVAGAAVEKTFVVQFCAAEATMDAKVFMKSYFLSTLLGTKVTSSGRKEFLHIVAFENTPIVVTCMYLTNAGGYVEKQKTLEPVTTVNQVCTIDVSPDTFQDAAGTLFQYGVKAGERLQVFLLDLDCPDAAPCLLFTNSFGCQETIYCTGSHALEPEFNRSSSVIDGKLRNYRIEENRIFKANTGVMNVDMSIWADDLFRSKEIYLLDGDRPGKEVTITESESKRSNDFDALPVFTFEYRYAQRNQNILQLPRAGRVFDNTFDNTFE